MKFESDSTFYNHLLLPQSFETNFCIDIDVIACGQIEDGDHEWGRMYSCNVKNDSPNRRINVRLLVNKYLLYNPGKERKLLAKLPTYFS